MKRTKMALNALKTGILRTQKFKRIFSRGPLDETINQSSAYDDSPKNEKSHFDFEQNANRFRHTTRIFFDFSKRHGGPIMTSIFASYLFNTVMEKYEKTRVEQIYTREKTSLHEINTQINKIYDVQAKKAEELESSWFWEKKKQNSLRHEMKQNEAHLQNLTLKRELTSKNIQQLNDKYAFEKQANKNENLL